MRKLCGFLVPLFVSSLLVGSQVMANTPQKVVSIEGITEYRLDNGLQVLLFPDSSKPTVTVSLTVFVGSRHEGYGEAGMAHLLEHMLFKGTTLHPKIPQVLQERGARFNGTTWTDRTNYYETLPASDENLEFAIRLEADRMVNSLIRGEDLASEMTVVRNEFERGENSPQRVLSQRIFSTAYDWHNYGKSTIGNRSDIERVPVTKLRDFYRRHYQPDNAMVVVAGQFDEQKALEYLQEYFGAIGRPERPLDRTYTEEPPRDGEREVTLRRVGDVALLGAAYHVPAGAHPDFASLRVLSSILTSEPAGRLYKALVETNKATDVSSYAYAFHDPGLMMIMAEVRRDSSLDTSLEDVRDTLLAELKRVGAEGVTAEEVQRARQQILKSRELELADSSRLAVALSNWAAQGDWRLYFLYRDHVEQVTPESVQQVAARYLQPNNRTLGRFIPTDEPQRVAVPARPNLEELVGDYQGRETLAAGEQFDPAPAHVESRTERTRLPDGLQLALLPKKTRGESVHLRLTLRYGNADNLRGFETAADLLPGLMTRGTGELSHQQIRDELDRNVATLQTSGSAGVATFQIQTKRSQLPAVLGLLHQVLRQPALPEEQFEVYRRQQLAQLENTLSDPQYLAGIHLRQTLFPYEPDDVRYTPTIAEQIERLQAVTLGQVRTLYEQYLGGQHGELTLVGDFEPEQIQPLLSDMLGGWESRMPYERIAELTFSDVTGSQHTLRTPDKANAVYYAGLAIPITDSHPDYPALVLGNFLFGAGALSSRLGDRVRQQEGLSYGVYSYLASDPLDARTRLVIYAITNPENSPKLIQVIDEELKRLLDDGMSDEELARAKQGYLQQQNVNRTNDRSLTSTLNNTLYADRTMGYYAELEERIAQLTAEQVVDALRRHIDPQRLVIVNAGDFK